MGRISFFLKEAFGSLRRNYFMTIAALVTVFLSIVVLGGVLVFVYTTDALLREVEQKVEITVFLQTEPDPTPEETSAMQTEIMSWPEVKSSVFVSKEDALERLREDFKDNPEILDGLSGNPLPASFEVSLKDPQSVDAVAARFDGNPIVESVNYGKEIADKIFSVTSQARNFLLIFIALLGIVAILLISNTIRLSIFARKREVEIMKLVGATNWFIRWPFVIEGVFVGFVGAAAAAVVVLVLNSFLVGRIRGGLPFMAVPLDAVPYVLVTIILLAVGVVIGAAGSGIGLRRFLRV
ncbi:MAG TPA: permease-like cell division protein FtsX [Thermoleophilia bacterium]|nr:permease-like cell division protein FtsX [Thermoleophilia bacterium]